MTIGEKIALLRTEANLSQEELAIKLNVVRQTVSKWELGVSTPEMEKLVQMAAEKGKSTRADIKLGICGEHGGDPSSVEFCHKAGLTYVSCSPFRVPIARLAAAQAAINNGDK